MSTRGGRTWHSILRYSPTEVSRATVRKCYDQYREEKGIPRRCDNPSCAFHTAELVWNGENLPLTLDHVNGVSRDNRPKNLRLLCPNCDSQLTTRGGKNKGLVEYAPGGFSRKRDRKSGLRDYTLPAEPGSYRLGFGAVKMEVKKGDNK